MRGFIGSRRRRLFAAILFSLVALPGFRFTTRAAETGSAPYLAGLSALNSGDFKTAQVKLGEAIEADSENPDYYTARGVAYLLAEKLPQANKDLTRALRLDPNHRMAKLWLSSAIAMTGEFFRDTEIFPAATNDLDESRIREASREYGDPVFRKNRGEPDPEGPAKQKAALAKMRAGARWYVSRLKVQPSLAVDLLAAAKQRIAEKKFDEALPDLAGALATAPLDADALYFHSLCLLHFGNYAQAREELTRALTVTSDYGEAYLARALAEAHLGNAQRARADFAIAKKLVPALAKMDASQIESEIGPVPAKLTLDDLIQSARDGASDDQLAAQALDLVRATNAQRLRYDETYQDRLRVLEDKLRAAPQKVGHLVALARFLHEDAAVRRERVEPRGSYRLYRFQTKQSQENELGRAQQLVDQALKLKPGDVDALTVKAKIDCWYYRWADAEESIRRALTQSPDSPELLELFAEILEVAAAQRSAQAAELRRPQYLGSEQERMGDYLYTYTYWHHPSQAELDQAQELDQEADALSSQAVAEIEKAATKMRGTAVGDYLAGVLKWREGEYQAARQSYEQAVKREPNNVRWRFNLAGIYAALRMETEAMNERLTALNMIETSAAPLLTNAWDHIAKTQWKTARAGLQRAATTDPADGRAAAYLGIVNAAEEKPKDALAYFRIALAIEAARLKLLGKSFDAEGPSSLSPEDYGLSLAIRHRAAAVLMTLTRFPEARDMAFANVAIEGRAAERDYAQDVVSGLLPDPDLDPNVVPDADNIASVFARSRVTAGAALNKLRQFDQAIQVLAPVTEYAPRLVNGNGVERLRGPELYSALELARAYIGKRDRQRAEYYARLLPRKRHGVGTSLGPFPELEDEGERLLAEISRMR